MSAYCQKPFASVWFGASHNKVDIRPCCLYQPQQQHTDIHSWLHSNELQQLQGHMLTQSALPMGCKRCQHDETLGLPSLRSKHNDSQQRPMVTDIVELEIFASNACNLSCLFCAPEISTTVAQEYHKIGWIESVPVIDHCDQALDTVKSLPACQSVSLIGGEFFVTKNALDILQVVIDRQLQLKLVTNATCLTVNHLEKLKLISKLDITVSIDGTASTYELLRYPAQWPTVDHNVQQLKQKLPQATVQITTVLHPLIVQNLASVFDWANQLHLPSTVINLQRPKWLSWAILLDTERSMLVAHLRKEIGARFLTKHQKQIIHNTMDLLQQSHTDWDLRKQFVMRLSTLIAHRSLSQTQINNVFGVLSDLAAEVWHHLSDSNARPLVS